MPVSKMYTPYILLADDDPDDRDSLIHPFLQQNPGVRVVSFGDGRELLSFLLACPDEELPVLILMDYKMPYVTAAEILQCLAGDPRYDAIPKLVWSTSGRAEYVDRCVRHGASQYFTKPNSLPELASIVDRMTGVFRSQLPLAAL
jgi:CheY-like chemotaxis protein